MQYEKRLKLINYIKDNFDLKNIPLKESVLFYFDSYDKLGEIKSGQFQDRKQEADYFHVRRYSEIGACIVSSESETETILYFEDAFLNYRENIVTNECLMNDLQNTVLDPIAIGKEMDRLVSLLNGEEDPQRVYNC